MWSLISAQRPLRQLTIMINNIVQGLSDKMPPYIRTGFSLDQRHVPVLHFSGSGHYLTSDQITVTTVELNALDLLPKNRRPIALSQQGERKPGIILATSVLLKIITAMDLPFPFKGHSLQPRKSESQGIVQLPHGPWGFLTSHDSVLFNSVQT